MQALLEILVGSHEDHRAFLAVTLGERSEAVVRLAVVGDFKVQAERLDEPMDGIDLLDEVFRGGAALGLVQREQLMPEVGAVPVEHKGCSSRRMRMRMRATMNSALVGNPSERCMLWLA